ncbi:3'-5' exonuclease [Streptomyces sp. B6B3]|uniref:3'-5' exonuclease n=1 Tax=Streptomyces sp. B6B3 TaxID=3153570 RepID=UPI00325D1E7A
MNFESWPRLLVVDVEGNGATPPDLVEVATLPLVAGTLDTTSARAWLVRPPVPVTPFASRVHKLTNADLASCPPWSDVADHVAATLDGAWICAHNASVEYRVLRRHLPDWKPAGVLDTLRLSRATLPDAPKHNLDALISHLNLDLTEASTQRHRAPFDAHAAALLLLRLAAHHPTWEALTEAAVPPGLPGVPEPESPPTLW